MKILLKVVMTMKKVTSKNTKKQRYRKNTFKFAECISMMDLLEADVDHVGLFFFVADKMMEVREREIARCEHNSKP